MRVVSLNCSNTEIVAALGLGDFLVGVDSDSDFPIELVQRLPRVGRDLDIDVAKVVALRPDLVLASNTVPGHEKVIARLHAAGLPLFAPETITFADVLGDIRDIAHRLAVAERGEALVAQIQTATHPAYRSAAYRSGDPTPTFSAPSSSHLTPTLFTPSSRPPSAIDGGGPRDIGRDGGVRKTSAYGPRIGTTRGSVPRGRRCSSSGGRGR